MKTLKESLLTDIDDTLNKGDKAIKDYNCWGRVFKLERTVLNKIASKALSLVSLKKLTNGMDFINDTTKSNYMYIGGTGERDKMFANWIDHISLDDLELTDSDLKTLTTEINANISAKLVKNLTELCKKNNVFNNINSVHIRIIYVKQISSSNQIEILIWKEAANLSAASVATMMKFVYEINV